MMGVIGFSLTLPMTLLANADLDPTFVGLGRAIIAAVLAAIALWLARASIPVGYQWLRLGGVALGIVVGFPLLSSWALMTIPAAHSAVIGGLLPLMTAIFAVILNKERPPLLFWGSTIVGSATIVAFSLYSHGGSVQIGDIFLIGAIIAAGFGYAEGAKLSKELGAWQTISWALLLSAPFLIFPVIQTAPHTIAGIGWASLIGFIYISVISMFLAFIAWYKGLAMGGIARIGQLQLLQPFMTIAAAAIILHESILWSQILVALIVLGCVIVGRRSMPVPLKVNNK